MTTKTIPLQAVKDALLFAIVRRSLARVGAAGGKPIAKFAAYTGYAGALAHTCTDSLVGSGVQDVVPCNFAPMERGQLVQLVQRVQRHRGGREVRKIWGCGVRMLAGELQRGVLV